MCLRVRDCCECFVLKYTHALTVLNEKFSILHEAAPRAFAPDKTRLLLLVFFKHYIIHLTMTEVLSKRRIFPLIFIVKVFKCTIAC